MKEQNQTINNMIKPSELRLGNWVKHSNEYMQVIELNFCGKSGWPEINGWEYNYFQPIPLTLEILEICGFKCTSKGFWVHDQWYNLSLKKRNMTYDLRYDFMGTVATNIDYLHHIQNIFFCLCGEELNFKP